MDLDEKKEVEFEGDDWALQEVCALLSTIIG